MKPHLNDCEAERMLENGEYIWSGTRKGYVRARRKGKSPTDYRRSEPDVISIEELSDNGLTDPYDALKERRTRFAEVALQLRREELPLTLDRIDHQLNYDALHELRHLAR